jgi:hypothetical protein
MLPLIEVFHWAPNAADAEKENCNKVQCRGKYALRWTVRSKNV